MLALTLATLAVLATESHPADTVRLEVGSPLVRGSVYKPHRARVRVHNGSLDTPPVAEWINILTVGDSAGRRVARWVTLGQLDAATGQAGFDLRQTFDLETMAPLGYALTTRNGARVRLAIDNGHVRGTRKTPADSVARDVDQHVGRIGFIASASDLVPLAVGFRAGAVYIAPVWGPNMAAAEDRIFSVIGQEKMTVEGHEWMAWRVEERRAADRTHLANWFLVEGAPYMVAGEVFLANGQIQRMTEISLPDAEVPPPPR